MIKKHIETIEAEINATGSRLETEELTADQLYEIAERMAKLAQTLTWLRVTQKMQSKIVSPLKATN